MSYPFRPAVKAETSQSSCVSLGTFDQLVCDYAQVRLRQEKAAWLLADTETEIEGDILRQRLRIAFEGMWVTAQRVVATAMVLSGNGVFTGCAALIEVSALAFNADAAEGTS